MLLWSVTLHESGGKFRNKCMYLGYVLISTYNNVRNIFNKIAIQALLSLRVDGDLSDLSRVQHVLLCVTRRNGTIAFSVYKHFIFYIFIQLLAAAIFVHYSS